MLNSRKFLLRKYVIVIIFILIFSLLMVIDFFSENIISVTLSQFLDLEKINFEFDQNFFKILSTKSNLINENLRLEKEVTKLRNVELEKKDLEKLLVSYENLSKTTNNNLFKYIETRVVFINSSKQFVINGGFNENFSKNDLLVDEYGWIYGYISEVRNTYSILDTLNSKNFSLTVIDEVNNKYLVSSSGNDLLIELTEKKEQSSNNLNLFTDPSHGALGRFKLLSIDNYVINSKEGDVFLIKNFEFTLTSNKQLFVVKLNE